MNNEYWKILGQHQGTAATLFQLYAVPVGRQTTVYSLVACNPLSGSARITIWIVPPGNYVDGNHILVSDLEVLPFTVWTFDRKIMLSQNDSIYVQSNLTTVIFSATGVEQYISRSI